MNAGRMIREGFVAGLVGAAAVAAWFLIVDTVAGRPFFTPAALGGFFFWGARDPAQVQIAVPAVAAYTLLHIILFFAVGFVGAGLAQAVESFPPALFIVLVVVAVFEFAFFLLLALVARPLLGALTWWSVAGGNALAVIAMARYFWRAHPVMRERILAHPLGAAMTNLSMERLKKSQEPGGPPAP